MARELADADPRIRCIRHETNRRLPGALNTAIRAMRGSFFTWISDDDLFRTDALRVLSSYLGEHPEVSMVFADYSEMDQDGTILRRITGGDPDLLGVWSPLTVCHLCRREVLDVVGGYDERVFLAEDLDFYIRVHSRFTIAMLHVDLFLYRQHVGSLTSTHAARVYPVHAAIIRRHREIMTWMTPGKWARAYARLAKRAISQGDLACGARFLARAVRSSPGYVLRKALETAHLVPRFE